MMQYLTYIFLLNLVIPEKNPPTPNGWVSKNYLGGGIQENPGRSGVAPKNPSLGIIQYDM